MTEQTQSEAQFFEVTPEFKKAAIAIIGNRPFAEVSNQMAVMRKDTHVYHIDELNLVIGYLGELPYSVVAGFFDNVRSWVKEATSESDEVTQSPVGPVSQVEVEETVDEQSI